jgi:hypothetical protein
LLLKDSGDGLGDAFIFMSIAGLFSLRVLQAGIFDLFLLFPSAVFHIVQSDLLSTLCALAGAITAVCAGSSRNFILPAIILFLFVSLSDDFMKQ